jgi:glycosyltransferase involved in cell wall biosynthesis
MNAPPRVAFFTDCFLEVNGVALTSKQLESFARKSNRPFLCVHATDSSTRTIIEFQRRFPIRRGRASFHVERDLQFDPVLWRHTSSAVRAVREFGANVIHVTSPGDVGLLGAHIAHSLKIPLVASWHTNLHEYANSRLRQLLFFLPETLKSSAGYTAQIQALRFLLRFYRRADVVLAPNPELVELLESKTGKPVFIMQRGVQTDLYAPEKRTSGDGIFRIGFVGRLSPEKNIRFLHKLEHALIRRGKTNFRFLIVGEGSERPWLEANLRNADFTGVLRNEVLAEAYANMDVFAFPSNTDTFGNVVLESLASGVPTVVMNGGGPKYLVEHGITGFVAKDEQEFIGFVSRLMTAQEEHRRMREAARAAGLKVSWDRVFEGVFRAYELAIDRHSKEAA